MTILFTSSEPNECAREHCDKHVYTKVEQYCRLLCTAHYVLDGKKTSKEKDLYSPVDSARPIPSWVRTNTGTYWWVHKLWVALLKSYFEIYRTPHPTSRLKDVLANYPKNLEKDLFVGPPLIVESRFVSQVKTMMQPTDGVLECYRHYMNARYTDWVVKGEESPNWHYGIPYWVDYAGYVKR